MDDLIFKNIPAGGFNTETGFTERVSNPTPSRKSVVAPSESVSLPDLEQRFSNPTPSRRVGETTESFQSPPQQMYPQDYSRDSRLSNPTPTRRKHGNNEPVIPVPVSPVDDSCSRLSNITPTRRRQQSQSQSSDFPSFGVIHDTEMSRASNPTPRRRKNEFVPEEPLLTNSEPQQQSSSETPEMTENIENKKDESFPIEPIFTQTLENDILVDLEQKQLEFSSIPTNPEKVESPSEQTEETPLINPIFDQKLEDDESLSFASVDNPYGVEKGEVNISEPVRIPFEADTPEKSINDGRMSQITPTHRKQG